MTKLHHSLPQQELNLISSNKSPHGIKFTSIFTQVTQRCTKDKAEKNTAVTTSHCFLNHPEGLNHIKEKSLITLSTTDF